MISVKSKRFMTSYRDYRFIRLATQPGGYRRRVARGYPRAAGGPAVRPQVPSYWAAGLTTNIRPTITNDFRFSYLRNFWQWARRRPPRNFPGWAALSRSAARAASALIPYNVNTQSVRQRFWDGQDKMLRDDVTMIKGNHLFSSAARTSAITTTTCATTTARAS